MKPHVKIYHQHFGITPGDFIPCEIISCRNEATDIHHIKCKGMGGSKKHDFIDNLMALCRDCHHKFGDKVGYYELLTKAHSLKLGRKVTIESIKQQINQN